MEILEDLEKLRIINEMILCWCYWYFG